MNDMFKKGDTFPVSAEFAEFVNLAFDGEFNPEVNGTTEIVGVLSAQSGQTLFIMNVTAIVDDPDNFHAASGGTVIEVKKFPATVAMVQKMANLKKKADKAAGIVAAPKINPNAKKVEPASVVDDYDPFAANKDDM